MTSPTSPVEQIQVKVDFGGGLEILFNNQRSHTISLPARVATQINSNPTTTTTAEGRPADVSALIDHLKDNVLSDRKRAGLFAENGTVRPGVLVLINDSDWEIEGEGSYVLKDGDNVSFISTLHGG